MFEQEGIDPLTTDEDKLQQVQTKAGEWYLALAFLMEADCTHYGQLLETYENDFTPGVDCYLRTNRCIQYPGQLEGGQMKLHAGCPVQ